MKINEWKQHGNFKTIKGKSIFYLDTNSEKETLVILHGYPTCSYDYLSVLPILKQRYHVIVHDHIGFGLSDKPTDYSYHLFEQADHAIELWQQLGLKKINILAHDYGTSVATEIIARHNENKCPIEISTVTLCNGSMHIELSQLKLIQKLLQRKWIGPIISNLSFKAIFLKNMRDLWCDKSKINKEELSLLWELLIHKNGRKVLPKITHYISQRKTHWNRWIGALQMTQLPINILWAENDPVAVKEMATVLHDEIQNAQLRLLPNLGHYPMLEAPSDWANAFLEMIEKRPKPM